MLMKNADDTKICSHNESLPSFGNYYRTRLYILLNNFIRSMCFTFVKSTRPNLYSVHSIISFVNNSIWEIPENDRLTTSTIFQNIIEWNLQQKVISNWTYSTKQIHIWQGSVKLLEFAWTNYLHFIGFRSPFSILFIQSYTKSFLNCDYIPYWLPRAGHFNVKKYHTFSVSISLFQTLIVCRL